MIGIFVIKKKNTPLLLWFSLSLKCRSYVVDSHEVWTPTSSFCFYQLCFIIVSWSLSSAREPVLREVRAEDKCFPSILFKCPSSTGSRGEIGKFVRNIFALSLQNKSFSSWRSAIIYSDLWSYSLWASSTSYVYKSDIPFLSAFPLLKSEFLLDV